MEAIALESRGAQGLGMIKRQVDMSLNVLMIKAQVTMDSEAVFRLQELAQQTGCVFSQNQEVTRGSALFSLPRLDQHHTLLC